MPDTDLTISVPSFDMEDLRTDHRGVSPVIGVVLMVAITVILAAIIASSVLGFGSNVNTPVNGGADITRDQGSPGTSEVTWVNGGNAEEINVTVNYNGTTATTTLTETGEIAFIEEDSSVDGLTKSGGKILVGPPGSGDSEITIVVLGVKGQTETVLQKQKVII
ncbi:type IV pilin [Halobacterium rubrum]|uniref:type IV pilin n=1 Tax=Halobacterium TaxID=2239 RepID=UPI001F47DE95|nr:MULTISPECIES: type IV pilin N-terminal domain-containing protein [Halobacterium]MDH5021699.1 type IV pilin N-terminal domain-containing protein [Halobacterium rubrum]